MTNTQEEQKAKKQFRVTEVKTDEKKEITYTVRSEFLIFTLQLKDEWNLESLKKGDSIFLPEELYDEKKAGDKITVDKESFFILFPDLNIPTKILSFTQTYPRKTFLKYYKCLSPTNLNYHKHMIFQNLVLRALKDPDQKSEDVISNELEQNQVLNMFSLKTTKEDIEKEIGDLYYIISNILSRENKYPPHGYEVQKEIEPSSIPGFFGEPDAILTTGNEKNVFLIRMGKLDDQNGIVRCHKDHINEVQLEMGVFDCSQAYIFYAGEAKSLPQKYI
jgi:hypothetical protein